jgi:hypothetical protein
VLYFAEEKDKKTPEYLRHMRYGMVLLWIEAIVTVVFSMINLWQLNGLVSLVYIIASVVFGYKAYNWQDVKIGFIDSILSEIDKKDATEKTVEKK